MIVSGGEKVYQLEVENLLMKRPDIHDAAVVGVDDHDFGKRLRAFVVRAPGAETDADELPRNATGKLLRRELEEATGPETGIRPA